MQVVQQVVLLPRSNLGAARSLRAKVLTIPLTAVIAAARRELTRDTPGSPRIEPLSSKVSASGKKVVASPTAAATSFDIFDGQGVTNGMEDMSLDDAASAAAAAAADSKPNIRVVVCGHVDSGKSTLNGHLVYQLGKVTDQEMRRVTKSAPGPGCVPRCLTLTLAQVQTRPAKKASRLLISWTAGTRRGSAVRLLVFSTFP